MQVEYSQWTQHQELFTPAVKHPQFILAVDARYFQCFFATNKDGNRVLVENFKDGINSYPAAQWLNEVSNFLVVARRELLDNKIYLDDDGKKCTGDIYFRQILPYCAICSILPTGEKIYYPYFRTNKVGESKLANKVSIGYGGHIDAPDVLYNDKADINLRDTIIANSIREILTEETRIYNQEGQQVDNTEITFTFADQFITQNTDPEILHLGVIMNMILPLGYRLTAGEDELEVMEPMTARQLLASEYTLEAWTRAMLEADVAEQDKKVTELAEQNATFRQEEAAVAEAITSSTEPLQVAIAAEEVVGEDERAMFINSASDVVAEALFQHYLGNDDDTVDMSVEPPKLKPFVPMMYASISRLNPDDKELVKAFIDGKVSIHIRDDREREIVLTAEEEVALKTATNQKLAVLKGQSNNDGADVESFSDTSGLLLDGNIANDASFNQMVLGDSGKTPTVEEVAEYLAMPIENQVKQETGFTIEEVIRDLGIETEVNQLHGEIPADAKLSDFVSVRSVDIVVDSENKPVDVVNSDKIPKAE